MKNRLPKHETSDVLAKHQNLAAEIESAYQSLEFLIASRMSFVVALVLTPSTSNGDFAHLQN